MIGSYYKLNAATYLFYAMEEAKKELQELFAASTPNSVVGKATVDVLAAKYLLSKEGHIMLLETLLELEIDFKNLHTFLVIENYFLNLSEALQFTKKALLLEETNFQVEWTNLNKAKPIGFKELTDKMPALLAEIKKRISQIDEVKNAIQYKLTLTVSFCDRVLWLFWKINIEKSIQPTDGVFICHDVLQIAASIQEENNKSLNNGISTPLAFLLCDLLQACEHCSSKDYVSWPRKFRNAIAHHQYTIYGPTLTLWNLSEKIEDWRYSCNLNKLVNSLITTITYMIMGGMLVSDTTNWRIWYEVRKFLKMADCRAQK